jgi:positive regulator of sigma E activity
MSEQYDIEKPGLVVQADEHRATVLLMDSGGCASCHNSLCMLTEAKSRYVDVVQNKIRFSAGDEVVVKVTPASAYRAAFWLYGAPFLMILLALFSLSSLGVPESLVGVSGLFILVPYYAVLYGLRKQLSGTCSIAIEKR